MMKDICDQLNFVKQCRKYSLPLWECPQFLTILFGLITVAAIIGAYFIGNRIINQPEIVALIVLATAAVMVSVGYLIIKSFANLAEANQMKTEFVSIVSHQLRSPLTIIKWTLNAIADKNLNALTSEQKEYLADVEKSNQQMIDLVNDLLDVSRIEQSRLKLEPKEINLIDATQQLVKEYAPLAIMKDLSVSVSFKDKVLNVWTDPQKIKIVMQNLLDNAIRYSVNGKKTVAIAIDQKNAKRVHWEIKDEGIGIPKREQGKIFQKFFRSQNSARYKTQGTGLGLFIAKAFIVASGGKIGFKSQENKGTTFWFELPSKKEQ